MDCLAEAVGGNLKEVESELSVVKVPRPKAYVGERSSKELENFLWDMVSPMILLNLLLVIPPEDPLGDDAIVQPVLEVIEVFVLVFALEPSEVVIDASLSHRGMLIEAIEDMVPNWDLDCGLEEMQLAALAHCLDTWRVYLLDRRFVARTCVLHSHVLYR